MIGGIVLTKKKDLNSVSNLKIIPLGGLEQIGMNRHSKKQNLSEKAIPESLVTLSKQFSTMMSGQLLESIPFARLRIRELRADSVILPIRSSFSFS